MGVNISIIIPNKHRSMRSRQENERVLDEAIKKVQDYFFGKPRFAINRYTDYDNPEISLSEIDGKWAFYNFEIPTLDMEINLNCGYWDCESYFHYCQYFMHYNNENQKYNFLRLRCFDLARIFGINEAWLCDEYHSWNSGISERDEGTFDDWLEYGTETQDKTVYEFHPKDCIVSEEWLIPEYETKYHDSFKECFELLESYLQKFPEYEILTISDLAGHILVSKDNELYLLNPQTGKLLTDFPIDGCDNDLNGAGIVVYKGKQSALFTNQGKQVTDFRVGRFQWEWKPDSKSDEPCVVDKTDGRMYSMEGTFIGQKK